MSSRAARPVAALRRRLEARRRLHVLEIAILGAPQPYQIAAPADPDAVLDEIAAPVSVTAESEPHMPYWATPWASGLALAEVALARRAEIAGRLALELGCGLGVTAAAALQAGAALVVADCFAEALTYCRYNALRNAGAEPRTILADWRIEAGRRLLVAAGPFDLLLAADVLYEPEDVAPLLDLVPRLLRPGGRFWLAEPGRATSATFVRAARERGWRVEDHLTFERDWPGAAGFARVTVHRYVEVR